MNRYRNLNYDRDISLFFVYPKAITFNTLNYSIRYEETYNFVIYTKIKSLFQLHILYQKMKNINDTERVCLGRKIIRLQHK